jgi:hypothetical protein
MIDQIVSKAVLTTKGTAKQGAGEQLQAYIRSAVWPLEEPDDEASMENGIFCECFF